MLKSFPMIRIIAIALLLVAGFMFGQSCFIGSYLKKATGVNSSGEISLVDLFKGELVFKNILIGSPGGYAGYPSVGISRVKLSVNWRSLLKKKACIKKIEVLGVGINNIYNSENHNNIGDISRNLLKYYHHINKDGKSVLCKIDSVAVAGIFVNTVCRQSPIEQGTLPNIFIKDVKSKNGIMDTIVAVLGTTLSSTLNSNDNRSFLDEVADYVSNNPTVKITTSETGLVGFKNISNVINARMKLVKTD